MVRNFVLAGLVFDALSAFRRIVIINQFVINFGAATREKQRQRQRETESQSQSLTSWKLRHHLMTHALEYRRRATEWKQPEWLQCCFVFDVCQRGNVRLEVSRTEWQPQILSKRNRILVWPNCMVILHRQR